MKKLILFLTGAVLYSPANAQINKERMMLGGNFNQVNSKNSRGDTLNNYNNVRDQNDKSFYASLRYGYFISDGFMIGAFGTYNTSRNENKYISAYSGNVLKTVSEKSASDGFSGGLFARYYNKIGKSRFAWFGELSSAYGTSKTKYTIKSDGTFTSSSSSEVRSKNFNVILRPGITYFFNKTIAAEAGFGYLRYYSARSTGGTNTGPISSTDSSVGANLNFSLSTLVIGFNIFFGG